MGGFQKYADRYPNQNVKGVNKNYKKATDEQLMRYGDLTDQNEDGQPLGTDKQGTRKFRQLTDLGDKYLYKPNSDGKIVDDDGLKKIKALRNVARRNAKSSQIMNSKKRMDGKE